MRQDEDGFVVGGGGLGGRALRAEGEGGCKTYDYFFVPRQGRGSVQR